MRSVENLRQRTSTPANNAGKATPLWPQLVVALGLIIATGSCSPMKTEVVRSKTEVVRPNILVLLADDLGFNDVGAYGDGSIKTPNIDRLAETGFRFTRFYTAGETCSPTRASLATGLYPQRLGFGIKTDQRNRIPTEVVTLPELLASAGYATHHIGKWHLGRKREEDLPLAQGYSSVFGFYDQGLLDGASPATRKRSPYKRPFLTDGSGELEQHAGHLTDILSGHAIDLIHESDGTQPWFINLWYLAVHTPIQPSKRWRKRHPDTREGEYYALVSGLDEGIGRIMEALEATGQIDNTIILFLSDNGPTAGRAPSNVPFFGRKAETFEGSVRVPLVIWFPERKGGSVIDTIVSSNDLYPTIASLAGVPVDHAVDGRSLVPLFESPPGAIEARPLFWETRSFRPNWGTRLDHLSPSPDLLGPGLDLSILTADGRWRLTKERGRIGLFNLVEDPTGHVNVFDTHPIQVKKMVAMYQAWSEEVRRSREGCLSQPEEN